MIHPIILLGGLAAFFLATSSCSTTPPKQIEDPIEEEASFALAPEVNVDFYAAHPRKGLSDAKNHIHVEDFEQAIAVLDAFQGPRERFEARRLFQLARAYRGIDEFDEAISYNDQAISAFPKLLSAYYNNACFNLTKDEPDLEQAKYYLRTLHQEIGAKADRLTYYRRMMLTDIDFDDVREESWFQQSLVAFENSYSDDLYSTDEFSPETDGLEGYEEYDNDPESVDDEDDGNQDEEIDNFELDDFESEDDDLYDPDTEYAPTLTSR